jgi:hypothetical protein
MDCGLFDVASEMLAVAEYETAAEGENVKPMLQEE